MSPEGLASAGMAMARINGSPGDGEGDWSMRREKERRKEKKFNHRFTDYTDYDLGFGFSVGGGLSAKRASSQDDAVVREGTV